MAKRYISDPVVVIILVAFGVFALWQGIYHLVFMELLPLPMVASHLVSLLVETAGAAVVTVLFVRALADRNRKLEELDRQKNLLVDTLVHDLRQPLTAVIGGLSSATESGLLSEPTRELLAIAQEGADWVLRMVNDLLDVTRLEAGQPLIEKKEIAPAEFIREGLQVLQALTLMKGSTINLALAPALPPILGDSERLRRVITNLVDNALKYTDSGSSISVTARLDPASPFLLVSVSDTGPGIPLAHQSRIFDKFGQVGERPSGGRSSTGLGLYYCKMMVEAHGGRIWVESEPDHGATFTFSIPIHSPASEGGL